MKDVGQFLFIIVLLLFSGIIYTIQILFFKDVKNTGFYLLQDLAFLPLQVLLITVILNNILNMREKRKMLKKLNMVIGAFFHEVGTELISIVVPFTKNKGEFECSLVNMGWIDSLLKKTLNEINRYDIKISLDQNSCEFLNEHLKGKRSFLLGLLENANLLEHDTFTDMLWAVFHITDELNSRNDFGTLPKEDIEHLEGDMKRAYGLLLKEWFMYMEHLKSDYPYLFSLALRKNPFKSEKNVIIRPTKGKI